MKRAREKTLLLLLLAGLVLLGCAAKSESTGVATESLELYGVHFNLEDEELDLSYIRIGDPRCWKRQNECRISGVL